MRFFDTFDESLGPYCKTMCEYNITILELGDEYNCSFDLTRDESNGLYCWIIGLFFKPKPKPKPILKPLPNIKILKFGYRFNKHIVLLPSITKLTFGSCFNKPIVLIPNITELVFREDFNQPIVLTRYLKVLTYDDDFNQFIILPQTIMH